MHFPKTKHLLAIILASAMLANPMTQQAYAAMEMGSISQDDFFSLTARKETRTIHGHIEFESMKVESTGLSILPGTHDPLIRRIKETLDNYNLVSHTQMRAENIDLYDDKLVSLVHTLGEFCSYFPKDDQIDDSVFYIINNLKELSPQMLSDIELVYKRTLVKEHTDGTLGYDGTAYGSYLFTQTDPEWKYEAYGDRSEGTIASSACGPTAMATIVSSYHHKEILPTELSDFSVRNGHRFSTGTATSLFTDAAFWYNMPEPLEVGAGSVDIIYEGIRDDGNMAIALMGNGCFTKGGHYVVLVGTEERDGKEYFLVSDPNFPNKNYHGSRGLINDDPNDNFVLAEKDIFKTQGRGFSWFCTDFRQVQGDFATDKTEILLADYSDNEFLSMVPVAVSQIVNQDTLYQIAKNNQNDSYARNPLAVPDTSEAYTLAARQAKI